MFETGGGATLRLKAASVSTLMHVCLLALLVAMPGWLHNAPRIEVSLGEAESSGEVEFSRPAQELAMSSPASDVAPVQRRESDAGRTPKPRTSEPERRTHTAILPVRKDAPPRSTPPDEGMAVRMENPAAELQAMHGAFGQSGARIAVRPGATQVLSDTGGVDVRSWLVEWQREADATWRSAVSHKDGEHPAGTVVLRFKVLPNGRVMAGSVVLEGGSGDAALDRAAAEVVTASAYPPLPEEFRGSYLELRAFFMYGAT